MFFAPFDRRRFLRVSGLALSGAAAVATGCDVGSRQVDAVFDAREYGDGASSAAINLAIAAAHRAGGGKVVVPSIPSGWSCVRSVASDQHSGAVVLRRGVVLRFEGAVLTLKDNCSFVKVASTLGPPATIVADTTVADTRLTLNSSAPFEVGGWVFLRIGQAHYDVAEPDHWLYATVASVPDGTHIVLDRPVGYALFVAGVPAKVNRQVQPITESLDGTRIEGSVFLDNPAVGGANAEMGIEVTHARDVYIEQVSGKHPGAGVVNMQFVESATIGAVTCSISSRQNGQRSKGRGFSLAECRNIEVGALDLSACEGAFVLVESRCDAVTVHNLRMTNTHPNHDDAHEALISHIGNAAASYENVNVDGRLGYFYSSNAIDPGSQAEFVDTAFGPAGDPTIETLDEFSGRLAVRGRTYRELGHESRRIPLAAGMTLADTALPAGLYRRISVYASDAGSVTHFAGVSGRGESPDYSDALASGQTIDLTRSSTLTGLGVGYTWNADETKSLRVSTDNTVPPGAFLVVETERFLPQEAD